MKSTLPDVGRTEPASNDSNGQSNGLRGTASNGAANGHPLRHVLEFERPLARLEQEIRELEATQSAKGVDYTVELRELRHNYTALLRKTYENLTAWETVQVARHPQRPQFRDYVERLCPEFRELHGDRAFGDDNAIVCGLCRIGGHKAVLIGHHKGRDTKEKVKCNFGCGHPEGYRKALRCMKLAEKFGLPVVCLIDTAGAYPGIGAEERGQAQSIAVNMMEMSRLRTPIVSDRHRRGGQRRRARPGRGRPGGHDGARLVLGHQPRGVQQHPVQGQRGRRPAGRGAEADEQAPQAAGRGRRTSCPSRWAGPTATRTRPPTTWSSTSPRPSAT